MPEQVRGKLFELVRQIHFDCFELCKLSFGKYLPVAGNVGVFCQNQEDFDNFQSIKAEITEVSGDPNQKYFKLKSPVVVPAFNGVPETIYTYLYIRKPSFDTPQIGDVDFILEKSEFEKLKRNLPAGAKIYDRPGWDMIELSNPNINSLAYVSYQKMAEKVRTKFD